MLVVTPSDPCEEVIVSKPDVCLSPSQLMQCFQETPTAQFGIEVEVFIVDQETNQPVDGFEAIYRSLPEELQQQTTGEFLKCQIEFATTPSLNPEHHRKQLMQFQRAASKAAAEFGAKLAWVATLPDWEFDTTMIRDCPRSRSIVSRHGLRARNLATCSMHVHTQVARSAAIPVVDSLNSYVPLLVALSANSPAIAGRSHGLASERANIWAFQFLTSGFPRLFGSWERFNQHIELLRRAGRIEVLKDLYYFVRPTRYGTVEVRCCDLPKDVDRVVALATLIQCSAMQAASAPTERVPADLLHANLVEAITHGADAELDTPSGVSKPANLFASSLIEGWSESLLPALSELATSLRAVDWTSSDGRPTVRGC
ncbi:MAG: YbdK family carboxylate-amine ligase [Planctomycetota bacterium]